MKKLEPKVIDLFDTPELIPSNIVAILEKYEELTDGDDLSYEQVAAMQDECEAEGYTFDYYLDAIPYNLRPFNS